MEIVLERDSILKQWLSNMKNKIWMPYVIILGFVLLAEVFLFNFSTWKTLGCDPVVLAENVQTNEEGVFSTGFVEIHDDVKNVDVNLDVIRYDWADVTVALTDAGDYYAYEMPEYTVVPGVKGCGYQNIYPFGEVNTIQVTVEVPEGTEAQIHSIAINVVRPLDFKILRVAVLFGVIAFGYLLFSQCQTAQIPCIRKNKRQMIVITAVIMGLFILAGMLARSNPVCVNSPWPHHRQYQELARSLKQGSVVIGEDPDPALLAKENPYDTSALLAEEIPFKMDYALYDRHYYAYFGIMPEVLFYLPYYLLTGSDLQNYMVVFALFCGVIVGVFGALWEVIHRYAKKVPFAVYLMLSVSVSLMPHYIAMIARPDIYNVPVMAGNAFIWLGAFCWMRGINYADMQGEQENVSSDVKTSDLQKGCVLWYGLGAFFIACIMGCRPQMILYGIALFGILLLPRIWKCRQEWKVHTKKIITFLVPFAVVGALVFWYNLARFGSGFDFGATYSLTSNDMNNRGFNFSRIIRGLYSFLFQPSVINATFPFLESCELESNYMGKNIVEFSYGGIFMICPMLLSLLYPMLGGWKPLVKEKNCILKKEAFFATGILCVVSLFVAAFDINAAGILQRYMCDMVFGLLLAAVLVIVILLDKHRNDGIYSWILKGTYLCVLFGIAFSFLVVITSADSICLASYNPKLFYELASYFKF